MTFQGHPVDLSAREFALLHALMLNAGRVLSREQLERQLYAWGEEVESNAIEVHIHHLRRKLQPELSAPFGGWVTCCHGSRMTKPPRRFSVKRRLLSMLLAAITVAWLITVLMSYRDAKRKVDALLNTIWLKRQRCSPPKSVESLMRRMPTVRSGRNPYRRVNPSAPIQP